MNRAESGDELPQTNNNDQTEAEKEEKGRDPQKEGRKEGGEDETKGQEHLHKNLHKANRDKEESRKERESTTIEEFDKTMKCYDTQIDISDSEDDFVATTSAVNVNQNNPKITISEPVNSPCESEGGQKRGAGGSQEPRGRCPIYYGIKSYIHDFYQPPDKELLKSGEFIQEDDFQFLVEPGKRRWRGCWLRTGLWVGINLMLIGIIAMLVGHLTKPRETIVDQHDNFTILDRWAVTFNNRLIICQLAGLAGFTSGAVIVMLALLVSSYQQEQTRAFYVMSATVVPETFVGNPLAGPRQGWDGAHRIPLSGSVRGVQPTLVRAHH